MLYVFAVLGIKSAKSAGLICIAINTTFPEKDLKKAGADLVIKYSRDNFKPYH